MAKKEQARKTEGRLEKRFQRGNCTASVFVNKAQKDGQEIRTRSVVLQKSYKDAQGAWQASNNYGVNDLPKVILAAQKAYDYLTNREKGD